MAAKGRESPPGLRSRLHPANERGPIGIGHQVRKPIEIDNGGRPEKQPLRLEFRTKTDVTP